MHVDTGHNFTEVIEYRDRRVAEVGVQLVVASVQESIDAGRVVEETGRWASRNRLQTTTLLDAIEENRFDAVFGGARRDEEKARAKERVFSFRDEFGQWDPKNQRPELWSLYNTRIRRGRAHPGVPAVQLDRAGRLAVHRPGEAGDPVHLLRAPARGCSSGTASCSPTASSPTRADDEPVFEATVRYRTVGDMTCTGAVESTAATVADVIAEVAATRVTERGQTRADDRASEAAMEDRKREGYF